MMMQASRAILAFGLAVGMAGAALAGPTGGPTPTPTATPTGTGSPSPTPTATATATVTGSPTPTATVTGSPSPTPTPTATATPTTTTTGTPTVTPTPTPTSAPPPGDLSGEHAFVDKDNFDKNETLMNVDTQAGDFCLAGRAVGVDPTTSFNRLVVFSYRSLGVITKADTRSVKGDFVDVELRLTIDELHPDGAINEFDGTIQPACRLKGSLQKEGEAARAMLQCDVGEFLSAFGLDPVDDQDLIENVADAFAKRRNLSVKVNKGKIKFNHRGVPAPGGLTVPLTCDLGGNNEG